MVCKCTHSMSAARVRRASLRLRPTKRLAFAGDDRIPRRRLEDLAPDDWRRGNPRFQGGAFERNVALADRVRELAATKGCTPAQLALAWLLTREYVIQIPGTSNAERLSENADAVGVQLTREDLDEIERRSPKGAAAGERYHPCTARDFLDR